MNTETESLDAKLTDNSEIVLKLERYEDIFSDFDMRPYARRAMSVDFIDELRRASFEKQDEGIELILNMPASKRNEANEAKIKERLKGYFKKHYLLLSGQRRGVVRRGTAMVAMGVIFMFVATFIHFENASQNLLLSFAVVLLEPASWFLVWEGLNQIFFSSKEANTQINFFKKMSHNRNSIRFGSY